MKQILIIGSGMTGITCARVLADAGISLRVMDKGRGIGGRMATRRVDIASDVLTFDHGAQHMRPRDPDFAQVLADAGAGAWADGAETEKQVGIPGMSAVPRALAAGLSVTQQAEVTDLTWRDGHWSVSANTGDLSATHVVLTIPAPQVAALLGPAHPFALDLARVTMDPCMTLMAAFPADSPRPFSYRSDAMHPLSWIAQDSTKPGRTDAAVTWVAQAGLSFSTAHLDASAEDISARMLPLLCDVVGADPAQALYARAHRWRYAQVSAALGQPFLRTADRTLYVGGDWCLGPRAEDAWASGRAIARDILGGADVV